MRGKSAVEFTTTSLSLVGRGGKTLLLCYVPILMEHFFGLEKFFRPNFSQVLDCNSCHVFSRGKPLSSRTWTPPAAECTRRAAGSTGAATSACRNSSTRGACSTYSGCAFRGVQQHLLVGANLLQIQKILFAWFSLWRNLTKTAYQDPIVLVPLPLYSRSPSSTTPGSFRSGFSFLFTREESFLPRLTNSVATRSTNCNSDH